VKRHLFGIIFIIITNILILTACSSSKPAPTENISSQELNKDELVLAVGGEPETGFDPTTGWGRYGSPLFQSTLFKRNEELKIVEDLAQGYQISDDGKVWTVTLRDDVHFSDGQPLTAEDVKFTFETTVNKASVVDLTILEKVEALNGTTVVFTLKKAQSAFIHTLATTGIVPKHAYNEDYAENPVGSGPYQLVQWDKGQQLIIEANANYYNKKPFFQKVTFLFLEEDAAFAAAKSGTVDVAAIPPSFSRQEVPGMFLEAVKTVDNRGIVFPYVPSGGKTDSGLPVGNDVTSDRAIRQAINLAIDRNALIEGVLEGYGSPAYTSVDGLPWWNRETKFRDADMEGAGKLLKNAGWKDTDGDGILEKDGQKAEFSLYYPAGDNIRQSLSIAAADMLKPLGISIIVEGGSWDKIEQNMHSSAVMMGWGSHNPYEMYNIYSSENAGVEYYNTGFYNNEKVDEYFKEALAATDEHEANEYWKEAQWDGENGLSARGDAPWAWLVNIDHLYLVKEGLDIGEQSIHPHGHGWPVTDNITEWKWSE
jgi:peptide/nickel transport system substrate-binding protein